MSINKAYLLGAGASMDAGLPLASGITSLALEHLNDNSQPSERDLAGVLNFVVAAMVAHAARHGGRPDQFPDIESVVSAVDLLASRSDVELTPFVQSWDPGVLSASRGRNANARTAVRKMREAIEAPRDLFAERPFSEAFDLMLDDRLGSDSGHLFKRLNVALMRMLLTILQTPEATRLAYLKPLVDLGAGTDGVTVATLNYDLTVETAAAEHGIAVSTGVDDWLFKGRVDFPADGIHLIKLHGSVGWTAAAPTATGLRLKPEPFDPRPPIPGSLETPAVIYGKRGKLRGDGPYLDLRGAFARALESVECLVAIGYSFGDDHVNSLIRRWLTAAPSRWLVSVDPSPPRIPFGFDGSFRGELARLIPSAHDLMREPGLRPQFYQLQEKAESALPRVCLPAAALRATFEAWEVGLRAPR